jgi:ATP-dependent 26S proteasome regulatory subunit
LIDFIVWLPFNERHDQIQFQLCVGSDKKLLIPSIIYSKTTLQLDICSNISKQFGIASNDVVTLKPFSNQSSKSLGVKSIEITLIETEQRKRNLIVSLHEKQNHLVALLLGKKVSANSYLQVQVLEDVFLFKCSSCEFNDFTYALDHSVENDNEEVPIFYGTVGLQTSVNLTLLEYSSLYTRPSNSDLMPITHDAPIYFHFCNTLLLHLEQYLSNQPRKGANILIKGAPGSGKTFLITETLKHTKVPFCYIDCSELNQNILESQLKSIFQTDHEILVLDSLDSILKSDGLFIYNLLLWLIGHVSPKFLICIFSKNITHLDSSIFSDQMFKATVHIGLPNFSERGYLLRYFLSKSAFQNNAIDYSQLAQYTNGFTPLDLVGLVRHAIILSGLNEVTFSHLLTAAKDLHPSNLSGLLQSKIPDIRFSSLYGIDDKIEYLKQNVITPFLKKDELALKGINPPKGLLIYGPSGTGKTSLAIATANATGLSCIYVDSTSIRSKIVGESEKSILKLFEQARSASPCILLMDQV